jgi:hypothetical protein
MAVSRTGRRRVPPALRRRAVDLSAGLRLSRLIWSAQRAGMHLRPARVADGLRWAADQAAMPVSDERPLFVLSAGWRSGSTLLQRLINSDPTALVWGEPYSETGLLWRLADSFAAFDPRRGRSYAEPAPRSGPDPAALTGRFTGRLAPHPSYLLDAHRLLLVTAFGEPARACGRARWGIKEVTLEADAARYVHTLFPQARTVFLVRHPVAAWQSYRPERDRRPWPYHWPDRYIFSTGDFGRMWAEAVDGFQQAVGELDARLVRYEDLTTETCLADLEKYLDVRLDRGLLEQRLGGAREWHGKTAQARPSEVRSLRRSTSRVATRLGYDV